MAFFPPRRIFPTTMFIFVAIMQCISVDFTSCGFVRLATSERRVPDFITLFAFTSVGQCEVKEPTTVK